MGLSKAFDILDHDLLIAKINTLYNTWSELIGRVPQGSVLGYLLFNLFINDISFIIKTDICNYSDDNTPYAVDMTLGGLMEKLESASNCALEWFCDNGMKPNSSHLLVCGHKFEVMLCKIGNGQVIETHLTKLLGIKMESELTFNKHMDLVCKKASQKCSKCVISFHVINVKC